MTHRSLPLALGIVALLLVAGVSLMRGDGRRAATPSPDLLVESGADSADVRHVLDAMRGVPAIPCEMALSAVGNWWGNGPMPDRNEEAWRLIVRVRQRITDAAALRTLGRAMRDADPCVSRLGARLLGRSRTPDARATLMAAMADADPGIRRLAALGLGFGGGPQDVTPLVRALEDRDATVRAAAAWALGSLH